MMRDISPGLEIIKEFEGFSAKPYLCPAKVWTIGYGTTRYPDGRRVGPNDPAVTKEQATEYLRHHCQSDCEALENFIRAHRVTLTNNQFSALISFSYNCGIGPVITPGKGICDGIRTKSPKKVVDTLMLYTRATVNGKRVILNGLLRRRKAEVKLYCS